MRNPYIQTLGHGTLYEVLLDPLTPKYPLFLPSADRTTSEDWQHVCNPPHPHTVTPLHEPVLLTLRAPKGGFLLRVFICVTKGSPKCVRSKNSAMATSSQGSLTEFAASFERRPKLTSGNHQRCLIVSGLRKTSSRVGKLWHLVVNGTHPAVAYQTLLERYREREQKDCLSSNHSVIQLPPVTNPKDAVV